LQEHPAGATETAGELLEKGAEWVGSTVGGAMKTVKSVMPAGQASDRSSSGSGTKRGANGSRRSKSGGAQSSRNERSRGRSQSRKR